MLSLLATMVLMAGSTEAKPVMAVLPFDNQTGLTEYDVLGKGLADMMITDLVAWGGVTVVEREKLESILTELKQQQTRYFDPAGRKKIGQLLGARYQLTGTILAVLPKVRIEARLFDTNKGETVLTARAEGTHENLFELQQEVVKRLIEGIDARLARGTSFNKVTAPDLSALLAYSKSLDLLDRGKLDEAQAGFAALLKQRPTFLLARDQRDAIVARLKDANVKREQGIVAGAADLARYVDETLAKPFPTEPDAQQTALKCRLFRGVFLERALAVHLGKGNHDFKFNAVRPGHEAQAMAGAKAWLDNVRTWLTDNARVKGGQAKIPQELLDSAQRARLFAETPDEATFARAVLLGDIGSLTMAPAPGDVDAKLGDAAMKELAALAARKMGAARTDKNERVQSEAIKAQELWADALMHQGKLEDGIGKLQEVLDAFPQHERFKAIDTRIRKSLEPNEYERLDWPKVMKTCEYWSVMKAPRNIVGQTGQRRGSIALRELVDEAAKNCKFSRYLESNPRVDHPLPWDTWAGYAEVLGDCESALKWNARASRKEDLDECEPKK